jgi:hypothetical protein
MPSVIDHLVELCQGMDLQLLNIFVDVGDEWLG